MDFFRDDAVAAAIVIGLHPLDIGLAMVAPPIKKEDTR